MNEFLLRVSVPDYIRTVEDFEMVVLISTHVEGDLPYKVYKPPHSRRIELKVYRGTRAHSDVLAARFTPGLRAGLSFGYDGHRWAYDHTSFDDRGDYDLIYRFEDEPREGVASGSPAC